HVGAQQHHAPLSVAQHPDHARAAHLLRHLIAVAAQPVGGNPCRSPLLHRQFRVGVNVLVNLLKLRQQPRRRSRKPPPSLPPRHLRPCLRSCLRPCPRQHSRPAPRR